MTEQTWRTCTVCGERKPSDCFYKDKWMTSGYRTDCKECTKLRMRKIYANNEENAELHRKKAKVRYDAGYRSPRLYTR